MVKIGEISVEITTTTSRLRAGLAQASSLIRDFALLSQGLTSGISAAFSQISTVAIRGLQISLLALTGTFAITAKAGIEFEDEITRAFVILREGSSVTGAALTQLTDTALELGRETLFSAIEAAQGMQILAKAGFDTREIIDSIRPTLDLAIVGNMELAESANIVIGALRGFNLETREAGRVSDVLALAASKSNTTVQELGNAFSYVAPVAAGAGLSIEETAAAIGILSNAGIRGSMAGTTLRRALSQLLAPTGRAKKIFDELGLSFVDSSGKLKPLVSIIRSLQAANINAAQAMQIFGLRAGPGMIALLSAGTSAIDNLEDSLQKAEGTANRMSQAFRTTVKGRLLDLKASVIDLGLAFYQHFKKPLADVIFDLRNYIVEIVNTGNRTGVFKTIIQGLLNTFTPFKGKIDELKTAFRDWLKALTPQNILTFFGNIRQKIDDFMTALTDRTATDTLEQIREKLDGIGGHLKNVASIATTVWGSIPNPWKPHIASLAIIGGLITKLFGGIFNLIIGWITLQSIVTAFTLKISFSAALLKTLAPLMVPFKILWTSVLFLAKAIIPIIATIAAIIGIMTLTKFISELKVASDFMAYISSLWNEIIARIGVATKQVIAFAKPWDEQAKKAVDIAKEEADIRVGATKEAAAQVVISWRESLNKVEDSFNLETMKKGIGETIADIGVMFDKILPGDWATRLTEQYRPEIPGMKFDESLYSSQFMEKGKMVTMASILAGKETLTKAPPGLVKPEPPTEEEALAKSFIEELSKIQEGFSKYKDNYNKWREFSLKLLGQVKGFATDSTHTLEGVDARLSADEVELKNLRDRLSRIHAQTIDKTNKATFDKPDISGGLIGSK
jgi:TP901 family phage tail tape measure protein